ncbi:hypothetical protein GOSPT_048_00080 [Gordonia sputi NBRC 100414]|uniref:Uncharacterized protein n=1 Tax=Gordonia sputi NBRC 100414 TaxID=1089453 RepID=H5TYS0_9ACTN|nr:hypothetical protein GOSPT_048_00080 [Gordonia sputi NBRC 100414]
MRAKGHRDHFSNNSHECNVAVGRVDWAFRRAEWALEIAEWASCSADCAFGSVEWA